MAVGGRGYVWWPVRGEGGREGELDDRSEEAKMGGMNGGYDEGARRPRERSQQKQSDVRDCWFVLIGWVMRAVVVFCCCQCIPSKKLRRALLLPSASLHMAPNTQERITQQEC